MMWKLGQHFVITVQTVHSLRKAAQVHSRIPEAQFHQDPQELLHAEQPLEQLQEQSAATTLTPAPTNLAFADFIKF